MARRASQATVRQLQAMLAQGRLDKQAVPLVTELQGRLDRLRKMNPKYGAVRLSSALRAQQAVAAA